jgi:hypothetical protein
MLITLKENGEIVNIENNHFGSGKISIEKQNLLSIPEIQKIISKKFPTERLDVLSDHKLLVYSHARVQQPASKGKGILNQDPGYRLLKETRFGKKWDSGFAYNAISLDPKKSQKIYHFDAVTGKLLSITETYAVTNEKN